MMSSALGAVFADLKILEEGFSIHLNWLGKFVQVIVESVGTIGVGVIVFALILKAITTPFDIYQRVKMRKQTLIMKRLKPELEKLQKQYANDKRTYSMKMYELQKKNGYSMFGACLPMIISLVVIIMAISAFQTYAGYANLSMYETMSHEYNQAILEHCVTAEDYRLAGEGEEPGGYLLSTPEEFGTLNADGTRTKTENGVYYLLEEEKTASGSIWRMQVESTDPGVFIGYRYAITNPREKTYRVNVDKLKEAQNAETWAEITALLEQTEEGKTQEEREISATVRYFQAKGAERAAAHLPDHGFLWVQNVWYPDVSYNHPIQADYNKFTQSFSSDIIDADGETKKIGDLISPDDYEHLTAALGEQKEKPNGYFIMIVLSIGLMLLSQFITMKSQKEADKYQTVDGQGAATQKVMMVMMPLMFAVFGFLWSAAFTIYNIVSSFLSIVFTLGINLVLDRIFRKKEEEELRARYTRTAPQKQEQEKKQKKRK